jgi:sugar lactone lactonase YvrE/enterochelin esterase-like enzyme
LWSRRRNPAKSLAIRRFTGLQKITPVIFMHSLALRLFACLLFTSLAHAADDWKLHPDAAEQDGVPKGTVTKMPPWTSKIFANTVRDWSVYVPAQYKPDGSAAVMVFQDGHDYVGLKGHWRVPTVFDNLIARGDMPPTVAIFLDPGQTVDKEKPASAWNNSDRSLEYDSLGDRYARFLLEEILPAVEQQWPLSHDPEKRAICGASSGGICSFTVAWERPDEFRKVLSTIGSFVNLRGGNAYPSLIRKTEHKPIRVFLQDSSGDLDNPFGNWPLSSQQMAAALKYMGYDLQFDYVEGFGHNSNRGGAIFPDAVKWLWRKEVPQPEINTKGDLGGDLTLLKLLIPGEGWQMVAEGFGFTDGPCSDEQGNLYFSDMKANAIYKLGLDGVKTKIADEPASGLKVLPGRLFACQGSKKRLVLIDWLKGGTTPAAEPEITVLADDVNPNDLAVTTAGLVYFTDTGKHQVMLVDPKTKTVRAVDTGIAGPNGLALSPDGGTLAVSDYRGEYVWAFAVAANGDLSAKAPYMTMRLPIDPNGEFKMKSPPPYKTSSGGDGMCVDADGRYYVTSALGVQIFDPTGRLCGVLPKPQPDKPLTNCTLAGPNRQYLYVTNGDKIFRRKVQAKGAN